VSWKRVKGHDAVVRAFQRVVQRDRLAHAYLFAGPSGIGKRLFAVELAQALLCENAPRDRLESCDQCPACALVRAGNHPDLLVAGRLENELELKIATVREFREGFALKPARGRGRVAILDDADFMNDEAANCLLKTLEEPPPRSVLLLIGTSPDRQLSTIVSRCQVVHFAPLRPNLMTELLRGQNIQDTGLLSHLVRLSGGSPGQALALADPDLWEFRESFLRDLSQSQPDSVALARKWMQFVENAGKEVAAQRCRAALVLRLMLAFFNDALNLSVGGTPPNVEPNELPVLRALAGRIGPDQWLELLERCLKADEHIDRRVQLVLVLEALLDALGQQLAIQR
jgi:DNA polymerase III subunit delta'